MSLLNWDGASQAHIDKQSEIQKLIKDFNKERRANKGKWFTFHGEVSGEPVAIKAYGTWIQVATFRGMRDGGPMDCTVTKMNEWLTRFLT